MKRITIIDGHPDADPARYGHAICAAYASAARDAGHEVRLFSLANLEIPILKSREQWEDEEIPAALKPAQEAVKWAEHVVFYYPLWLGDMPALLKAFLEQAFRPGFALDEGDDGDGELLEGRSARIIVTMGMPAFFYRAFFASHSVRSFKRNILKFTGFEPVSTSLIGNVDGKEEHRKRWLKKISQLGASGQ
ncbi:NAD(P)H-dependent oxidoreductase [Parasphingorhabdus sp.]|uniref:NAD(P)H-dependent oxidoreductase n=1 Tax=Parasphingorhabdus sp. TaxID=2709688 RepID=UPI002F92A0BF